MDNVFARRNGKLSSTPTRLRPFYMKMKYHPEEKRFPYSLDFRRKIEYALNQYTVKKLPNKRFHKEKGRSITPFYRHLLDSPRFDRDSHISCVSKLSLCLRNPSKPYRKHQSENKQNQCDLNTRKLDVYFPQINNLLGK